MRTQLHQTALIWSVIRTEAAAALSVALLAATSPTVAQTLLFTDDFSDPKLPGWTMLGSGGLMTNINQQLVRSATCGPLQTNNPLATHFPFCHPIQTPGPLPDNWTLEGRAELISANPNDAWASVHFLWNLWNSGQGYVFYKDQDEIALLKFWGGGASFAWFFYEERELKNTNVTLVLAFTRRGSNLEINTRVLDKDHANAVLYNRTVIDTPQADPVLPNRSVRGVLSTSDVPGLAWPLLGSPAYIEGELQWANPEHAPAGVAQVIYDNVEVWLYESPRPNVVAWGGTCFGSTDVPAGLSNVVAVAAGGLHSLALRADGTVVAWGGYGYPDLRQNDPPAGLSNVVAIAAGGYLGWLSSLDHSLALRADGTVVLWGQTWHGGSHVPISAVPDGLTNVVAVAAGELHSLALRSDGTVAAWVVPEYGVFEPAVPVGLSNVVAVAAGGERRSLALRADGTVVAWVDVETAVPTGLSNVVALAAGEEHSLALRADGTVVAWGTYQDGSTNYAGVPMTVPAGLTNVVAVAAGQNHCIALRADGTTLTWGGPSIMCAEWSPGTGPPVSLTNVVAVAAGSLHALALIGDGPPVVSASLSHPSVDANGFNVSLPTQSGRVYALEYKNSLTDADWTRLSLVAGTGHERTLTDPTANGAQRFYRVRRW